VTVTISAPQRDSLWNSGRSACATVSNKSMDCYRTHQSRPVGQAACCQMAAVNDGPVQHRLLGYWRCSRGSCSCSRDLAMLLCWRLEHARSSRDRSSSSSSSAACQERGRTDASSCSLLLYQYQWITAQQRTAVAVPRTTAAASTHLEPRRQTAFAQLFIKHAQ
jgi:hypothetical protein